MTGYLLLTPEMLLLVVVAWAMFAERLPGGDRGAAWVGTALATLSALVASLTPAVGGELFGGLVAFDGIARFARTGVVVLFALWLLWTAGRGEGRIREGVALAALATIGCMIMTEARELVTLVLAIELATLPAYVLIGYRKERVSGLEGALKYFLLSMMTSLVMLYGMSFLYGVSGSTRFAEMDISGAGALGLLGVIFTFVGIFAKVSAVPFHYWAPDAYEGAQSWSVAFVSTIPKIAGTVAAVRLAEALMPAQPALHVMLVAVAAASMVLGNLSALTQSDVRRLMAYSGVGHIGYLLLAVSTGTAAGFGAAVLYAVAYSVATLGIMLLAAEEGPSIDGFTGMSARRPLAAWCAVLLLASLIGIPPLIGFFGKLYLFATALQSGLAGWVALAVAMSVVSAGYYLRIVKAMFFADTRAEVAPVRGSRTAGLAIALCALLVIGLGLAAGPLLAVLGTPIP